MVEGLEPFLAKIFHKEVIQLNTDWSVHNDRLPLKIDEPFCAIKLADSPSVDKITACKT